MAALARNSQTESVSAVPGNKTKVVVVMGGDCVGWVTDRSHLRLIIWPLRSTSPKLRALMCRLRAIFSARCVAPWRVAGLRVRRAREVFSARGTGPGESRRPGA